VLIEHEQLWQNPLTMLAIGIRRFDIRQDYFILMRLLDFAISRGFQMADILL
jgi:hypothetical protein